MYILYRNNKVKICKKDKISMVKCQKCHKILMESEQIFSIYKSIILNNTVQAMEILRNYCEKCYDELDL